MRISNSFSEGEVQVLEFILQTLLRGGTPSMATRNKDFASLYRKVITMKTRVEKKKKKDRLESSVGTIGSSEEDELEESSVGTIAGVSDSGDLDASEPSVSKDDGDLEQTG